MLKKLATQEMVYTFYNRTTMLKPFSTDIFNSDREHFLTTFKTKIPS